MKLRHHGVRMVRGLGLSVLLLLASCEGGRDLCCGYETSEDWTSDVSISRNGIVVLTDVRAIIEEDDRYIVETRPVDKTASRLVFEDCAYVQLYKKTGAWSRVTEAALNASRVDGNLVLVTHNSCLIGRGRSE